jgi:hypothetical protein
MTQIETQTMDAITSLTASTLAEKIKAGEVSALEVTEAHIRRIEAVNAKINAVVFPLFDEARAQAAEADGKILAAASRLVRSTAFPSPSKTSFMSRACPLVLASPG